MVKANYPKQEARMYRHIGAYAQSRNGALDGKAQKHPHLDNSRLENMSDKSQFKLVIRENRYTSAINTVPESK